MWKGAQGNGGGESAGAEGGKPVKAAEFRSDGGWVSGQGRQRGPGVPKYKFFQGAILPKATSDILLGLRRRKDLKRDLLLPRRVP